MLALSEHGLGDQCGALPSITDLYAGACPGRGTPQGLTPADSAYLAALYERRDQVYVSANRSAVAERMARLLDGTRVARLGPPVSQGAPHPAGPTGSAPVWFKGGELIAR